MSRNSPESFPFPFAERSRGAGNADCENWSDSAQKPLVSGVDSDALFVGDECVFFGISTPASASVFALLSLLDSALSRPAILKTFEEPSDIAAIKMTPFRGPEIVRYLV